MYCYLNPLIAIELCMSHVIPTVRMIFRFFRTYPQLLQVFVLQNDSTKSIEFEEKWCKDPRFMQWIKSLIIDLIDASLDTIDSKDQFNDRMSEIRLLHQRQLMKRHHIQVSFPITLSANSLRIQKSVFEDSKEVIRFLVTNKPFRRL